MWRRQHVQVTWAINGSCWMQSSHHSHNVYQFQHKTSKSQTVTAGFILLPARNTHVTTISVGWWTLSVHSWFTLVTQLVYIHSSDYPGFAGGTAKVSMERCWDCWAAFSQAKFCLWQSTESKLYHNLQHNHIRNSTIQWLMIMKHNYQHVKSTTYEK